MTHSSLVNILDFVLALSPNELAALRASRGLIKASSRAERLAGGRAVRAEKRAAHRAGTISAITRFLSADPNLSDHAIAGRLNDGTHYPPVADLWNARMITRIRKAGV